MSKVVPFHPTANETRRIFKQAILLAPNTPNGRLQFTAELIGIAADYLCAVHGAAVRIMYVEDGGAAVAVGPIDDVPKVTTEEAYKHPAPSTKPAAMSQTTTDVLTERRRQVEAEGWTPEHDDEHGHGQMARAAACYALSGSCPPGDVTAAMLVDLAWPWPAPWWKPTTSRRDLVKAAALILAEIERLDRADLASKAGEA